MALRTIDRNHVSVVTVESDASEPRTKFHIRTLTLMQRLSVIEKSAEIHRLLSGMVTPGAMREAVGLALEAWEMLVVDVTMVDAEVPKKNGIFGQCVPKEWYNEVIGDERVLFDVVASGLRVNTAGEDEKKASGASCGSVTTSESPTVPVAKPAGSAMQEAVTAKEL